MPIVVGCKCGRKFKAKDKLAGKKVRCPACQNPIRIPDAGDSSTGSSAALVGAGAKKAKSGKGGDISQAEAQAALLKFEVAQKRKQIDAEAEAAYREEQNKLIESYDQLTGRHKAVEKDQETGEPKKRKGEFTEGPIKKATIFNKIADAFAAVFGTLIMKYLIIALLVAGGAVGSAIAVKKMMSYTSEEIGRQTPKEERIRELEKEARAALGDYDKSKNRADLMRAKKALDEIIHLDVTREKHRTYQNLKERLQKAFDER